MTGCYEYNSSPSLAGRGGDSADQWPTHLLRHDITKSTLDRWNIWARWSYSGIVSSASLPGARDFIRQGSGCDRSSGKNQRPKTTYSARQFRADGAVCGTRIRRWHFVRSWNQLATSGRSASRFFISQGWSARYADEHKSRLDGSRMVGAGITRGHHTGD